MRCKSNQKRVAAQVTPKATENTPGIYIAESSEKTHSDTTGNPSSHARVRDSGRVIKEISWGLDNTI